MPDENVLPLEGVSGVELVPGYKVITAPGMPVPENALLGLQAVALPTMPVHADATGTA